MSGQAAPIPPNAADASTPAPKPEAAAQELPKVNFALSPVPANPLGEGRYIRTAAALVIGCVLCYVASFLSVPLSAFALVSVCGGEARTDSGAEGVRRSVRSHTQDAMQKREEKEHGPGCSTLPEADVGVMGLGGTRRLLNADAFWSCCSDEILNGKTLDRNSNYFARFCFENGIDL